ncbi:MAG: ssuB1 [Oscillospiraceae bacterium]|nr:ssuB1 [Oscillospiraceae bacterium]
MSQTENGVHIAVNNLSKQFGSLSVLEHVDITIEAGDFVAIVGRSGCGKSTLLRLISGLDQPSSGGISVANQEVRGVNSDVRFVFQEARLLPWKTAVDNVKLGAPNRDQKTALSALASVGLEDRAKNFPIVLSGGQRQRVSLARAIAGKPRALLLDEPLGALDALTRIEMQNLVETLWLEQGFTAVLVTHDVSEAVRLADRVIVMDHHTVAFDIRITLDRPRQKGPDFAYFEQKILNKVLNIDDTESGSALRPGEYAI